MTWARFSSSRTLAPDLPVPTCWPVGTRWAPIAPMATAPSRLVCAVAAFSSFFSCPRIRPGAASECCSAAFFSPSALVNEGSLDFFNCASVTCAVLIRRSTLAGPEDRSVADGGSLSGRRWPDSACPGSRGPVRGQRYDLLGDGCRGVRRGRGRRRDLLGRVRPALADLAPHLIGLAGIGELVRLVEVLRRLLGDRLLDRPDERVLVEVLRLGLVHLLGVGGLALRLFVVLRRRAASCAAPASAFGGGCEAATERFLRRTSFLSVANFGSAPGPGRALTSGAAGETAAAGAASAVSARGASAVGGRCREAVSVRRAAATAPLLVYLGATGVAYLWPILCGGRYRLRHPGPRGESLRRWHRTEPLPRMSVPTGTWRPADTPRRRVAARA